MIQRQNLLVFLIICAFLWPQHLLCSNQEKNQLWKKYDETTNELVKDDCLHALF